MFVPSPEAVAAGAYDRFELPEEGAVECWTGGFAGAYLSGRQWLFGPLPQPGGHVPGPWDTDIHGFNEVPGEYSRYSVINDPPSPYKSGAANPTATVPLFWAQPAMDDFDPDRDINQSGPAGSVKIENRGMYDNTMRSIRSHTWLDWHHVAFIFQDGSIQGFIDGIADPGLRGDYDEKKSGGNTMEFRKASEFRIYRKAGKLTPQTILPHAALGRYWGHEPSEEIPFYESALLTLPPGSLLLDAHWEGFIPEKLRLAALAAEELGSGPPLSVDLLCYSDSGGKNLARTIPVAPAGWQEGGGTVRPELSGIGSVRVRVRMDARAIEAAGDPVLDTPVLDSVSLRFQLKRRWGTYGIR